MSFLKKLDEHFEEALLVLLLASISIVMMAQIIARTFFASMTWPEEFSRYCYIWSVFLSIGYTIKKGNMLRVGVVMDLLPQKLRKINEIFMDLIMLVLFLVLFRYAIAYTVKLRGTGQFSPAMHIPMWLMYCSTILGYGLACVRTVQVIVKHIKNFNIKIDSTMEATLKEALEEIESTEQEKELTKGGGK
ncbi:MAG: TRAP transporter small permease [Peptostreptococcaceae bacterium]|nr:TRAP transporter small permease [Peptostreptococcaceae bacterium]